ncbi:hypothetical protein Tco_1060457, partial [Tanacetum coccineum]
MALFDTSSYTQPSPSSRFEDELSTTAIAKPNNLNIGVQVKDLYEMIRHKLNKVEAVKTSRVATSEEHNHQENQDNLNKISEEKDDAKPLIFANTFGSNGGDDPETSGPETPAKEVVDNGNGSALSFLVAYGNNESEDKKVERDAEREGEPTILATFGSDRDGSNDIDFTYVDDALSFANGLDLMLGISFSSSSVLRKHQVLIVGNIGQGIWCDNIKSISNIESINGSFKNSFSLKVSNDLSISFWKDVWCPDGSRLMDLFSKLFALDSFQDCKIGQRWGIVDGNWKGLWAWRIPPRGRALDDIASLTFHIGNFTLSDGDDKWVWKGDAYGNFK